MEYHDAMVCLGRSLAYTRISWNIKQHRGITRNIMMSWSWKLAACTRIPWDIEEYSLNILEYTENRRISRNIMERHEKSWCHGLPWKLTEYTGISLNIEEHDGMAYVVISCIAESPITPLGLASTTLGIFLYRRREASAPEPPSPQKWEKGWPHQPTRGMSWNSAEYHDVTSGSVLEARCVY